MLCVVRLLLVVGHCLLFVVRCVLIVVCSLSFGVVCCLLMLIVVVCYLALIVVVVVCIGCWLCVACYLLLGVRYVFFVVVAWLRSVVYGRCALRVDCCCCRCWCLLFVVC